MKTRIILFSMIGILFSFSSCQKIQDALTVTVPVDFKVDLKVNGDGPDLKSAASMNDFPFLASEVLDPNTNSDYVKYQNKINSITPTAITYTVSLLPEPVTIVNAMLEIKDAEKTVSWSMTNITLENGNVVTVPITQAQIDEIKDMFARGNTITVTWSGNSTLNVSYTLGLALAADVKARILG